VRGYKRVITTRYPAACWSLAEIPAQRGCRELHFHRQMSEKFLNFMCAHLLGVALMVEENVTFDPGNVGVLSPDGIEFEA